MPFIHAGFSQVGNIRPPSYGIYMRPSYLPAISDLIRFYKWKSIIYLYDSDDGKAGRKLFVNKILHLFYSNFLRKYFARESKEVKWVYRLQNEFDYYLFKSLFLIST